ncbi:MAG: class I SAM-dependent methyltransferase [Candidatus Thermoplasmatota archaeon]|nr:class I SAM-dependent methyltransferase [Candidatus Thermoplasmatota archaeon]
MKESGNSRKMDFERPSALFRLEDRLKAVLGERFLYRPFYEKNGGFRGDERVLDFGCGGGVGTRCISSLLTHGGSVTGVDVSSFMLERARKRLREHANAAVLHGDIRALDLGTDAFDVISEVHVLHDIDSNERASYVEALALILRPEGRIWVLEPTRQSHGMPVEEIRALMSRAGLEEVLHEANGKEYRGVFRRKGETT